MRSGLEDVRELTDLYWQRGQSNHPSKPASESNFKSSCTKGIYMYILYIGQGGSGWILNAEC